MKKCLAIALGLFIVLAVGWAVSPKTLETAFSPYIPEGLHFDDSPEKVLELMGWEPDSYGPDENGDGVVDYCMYILEPPISSPKKAIMIGLVYSFGKKGLNEILLIYSAGLEHRKGDPSFVEMYEDLEHTLIEKYGRPQLIQDKGPPGHGHLLFSYHYWPFKNNGVIFGPVGPERDDLGNLIVVISPRSGLIL